MARKAANGFEAIADMSRAPAAFCRYSIPPESWPSTNSLAVGTSHSDRARVPQGQNVLNAAFAADQLGGWDSALESVLEEDGDGIIPFRQTETWRRQSKVRIG
jgi:hypothetical protein